ncbi:threonine/serine ThrE exporter family protein [Macrococcus lamae]|uniref:Threonine/serine exporter n=1 Tax=Macrococcus lamae TaxID=198484 RepID=A0A4R6BS48_9STAP|nr:threonine/serine exporter family protein [Macrococcus lamae]TDM05206.1 threonine/serine exporter [Macrococcus lamae]
MNDDLNAFEEKLKDVIMTAGQVLLESGAEGQRIEETMNGLAHHYGYHSCESFVTNTVINFSLHHQTYPRISRVKSRHTNLRKISYINRISRELASNRLTIDDAHCQITSLDQHISNYNLLIKAVASAVIGLSFLYLQNGSMSDVAATMLAAALGYVVTQAVSKHVDAFFIPEFIGSLCIALIAVTANQLHPDSRLTIVIISAVMPIVPGVLITNAIQDLLAGNMMMFVTKGLEAVVTSFAIGAGVATIIYIFREGYDGMDFKLSLQFCGFLFFCNSL